MTLEGNLGALGLQVANHITAMLAYWDRQLICRFANKSYTEWFGKSPEEIVDKMTIQELLGPLYEKNLPYIEAVLEGKPQVFERSIQIPSGEIRYTLVNYYPDVVQGMVQGFFVHVADITKTQLPEMELKASETQFRGIVESAPDCLIIVNSLGIIKVINTQCEKVFGYSKDELLGQPIEILLPEHFRTNHCSQRASFFCHPMTRPMGRELDLWGLRKNGEEFPVEISLSPLETEEGILVSAAVRDVSWKVEKERELRRSNEIIRNQNERLLNFTYTIAHNLRSYSVNLSMLLTLLVKAPEEKEREKLLGFLQQTSERFSETVGHLNEIVDAQNQLHVAQENVNLSRYIDKCLTMLQPQVESSQARIHNRVNTEVEFTYNPAYLESILFNFLSNAIKYRHPARVPEITINATKKGNELVLHISDNGIGINLKKNCNALFGMYKTFHGNVDAKGLGLFITRYQVEALGGHIEVESEIGVGTTFHVYLLLKGPVATQAEARPCSSGEN
jgi:PAS domain S-box-containing protein